MVCKGCGAPYRDTEPKCPFCGRLRAEGRAEQVAERQQATARADAEAARLREAAQTTVERCARHSLYWACGGLLLCFFPVGAVVAVVLAVRGKLLARQHGLIAPAKATVSLSVAALQILGGAGVLTLALQRSEAHDGRVQKVAAQLGDGASQRALSPQVACAIAELHLLTEGHDGIDDMNIERVRCPGKLSVDGDGATLSDVRFNKRRCRVTLRFGTAWDVETVGGGPECAKVKPAPGTAPAPPTTSSPAAADPGTAAPTAPPSTP